MASVLPSFTLAFKPAVLKGQNCHPGVQGHCGTQGVTVSFPQTAVHACTDQPKREDKQLVEVLTGCPVWDSSLDSVAHS